MLIVKSFPLSLCWWIDTHFCCFSLDKMTLTFWKQCTNGIMIIHLPFVLPHCAVIISLTLQIPATTMRIFKYLILVWRRLTWYWLHSTDKKFSCLLLYLEGLKTGKYIHLSFRCSKIAFPKFSYALKWWTTHWWERRYKNGLKTWGYLQACNFLKYQNISQIKSI